jgi:hypothetical protein
MDRADETVYPAGVPGVPHVNLWVKFSAERRGFLFSIPVSFSFSLAAISITPFLGDLV